jgi:NAD(P)-dependent dehydrogenase (short-subunit alcohol dehydrogenase family)
LTDLAGRTAFVTGGANGIGLGLARVLLDQGCKVAIADIREESIAAALASLDNREVMGVQLNVTCSGRSTTRAMPTGTGCLASIWAA